MNAACGSLDGAFFAWFPQRPRADLPLDRLVVKSGGSTRFVRVADIDWIEAAGVYANLHIGGKELLYRAALNELAERLDPVRFVRVHRSAIVNIESILHLEPISHGEFEVILKDGSRSRISRTYRSAAGKEIGSIAVVRLVPTFRITAPAAIAVRTCASLGRRGDGRRYESRLGRVRPFRAIPRPWRGCVSTPRPFCMTQEQPSRY